MCNSNTTPLLTQPATHNGPARYLGDSFIFGRLVVWTLAVFATIALAVYWTLGTYEPWIEDYKGTIPTLYRPGAVNMFQGLGRTLLPIHLITGPIAILGGFLQFVVGAAGKGPTELHRYLGRFLILPMTLCLLSSMGMSLAAIKPRGWTWSLQLLLGAFYTGNNLAFGIYYVMQKKNLLHKESMLRVTVGFFNFVTNRMFFYYVRESYGDTAWLELTTLVSVEGLIFLLRKEPWWAGQDLPEAETQSLVP